MSEERRLELSEPLSGALETIPQNQLELTEQRRAALNRFVDDLFSRHAGAFRRLAE